jgi:apolipoprotein D and lipocalin family protein
VWDPVNKSTWGMSFVPLIKMEYLIAYLDADYQTTIIARNSRDYVWLMSRKPIMEQGVSVRWSSMLASVESVVLLACNPQPYA